MVFELMNLVSPFNYTNNVLHLNISDILDQPAFDKLELSAKYWLDVRHCYRYGKKNPQQLFEIFGGCQVRHMQSHQDGNEILWQSWNHALIVC